MRATAVRGDDDFRYPLQRRRIFRPTLGDRRLQAGNIIIEALGQQDAIRVVLVLGIAMAAAAGDEQDLLRGACVGGRSRRQRQEQHEAADHHGAEKASIRFHRGFL